MHHSEVEIDHPTLTAASLNSFKTTFDQFLSVARWLGPQGLRFVIQFWYSKEPVFWLPKGWVPYPVEWILAFPKAPTGSISVQVWFIACTSVIQLVGGAVKAAYALMMEQRTRKTPTEPLKFGSGAGTPVEAKDTENMIRLEDKKEL